MGRILDKILERRRLREVSAAASAGDGATGKAATATAAAPCYYSFEFFPPKTEAGFDNLLVRIERMVSRLDPVFVDVTWSSAGGSSSSNAALTLAEHVQRYLGVDVLLHLTCSGASKKEIRAVLDRLKAGGSVRNVLALRGDPPPGRKRWDVGEACAGGDFPRAVDLVRFIKSEYGDYFGVAVAGHPEGHPASTCAESEIAHLKEKVDAGADFVVTQFFYDCEKFVDYARRCRAAGIACPIIPGILPIQSYGNLRRMTEYCDVKVPQSVWDRLEPAKSDDEAVKHVGVEVAAETCARVLEECRREGLDVDGVHFFTLNLERSVTQVLAAVGAFDAIQLPGGNAAETSPSDAASTGESDKQGNDSTTGKPLATPAPPQPAPEATLRTARGHRLLPWRPSAVPKKNTTETVRPINWANRPKSYLSRTEDWDEFPNGRWGDSTSPAFGELSNLPHFYHFSLGSEEDRRAMLGRNPTRPEHVHEVFALYVEGRIPHIPWCETPLQPESFLIQDSLARINRAGYLSVNSQPSVDGEPSTHPTFGWGGPGGYVYQKAYCECFCSPDRARRLAEMVREHPSMNLYAVNYAGEQIREGIELGGVTALTWGVFPNREILQPTVFDPDTFLNVWAEEAFSLWTGMWLHLYEYDSESYELIEGIRDTYYLCAIIDNAYVSKRSPAVGEDGTKGNPVDSGSLLWKALLELT